MVLRIQCPSKQVNPSKQKGPQVPNRARLIDSTSPFSISILLHINRDQVKQCWNLQRNSKNATNDTVMVRWIKAFIYLNKMCEKRVNLAIILEI